MTAKLDNPYAQETGQNYVWLKGNLHTHSDRSDGTRPMQDVIDAYAKLKYDFLAMTDHDVYSDYRGIDARGMILLPGNEVTAFGNHVLQLGGTRRIEPADDRQQAIGQIVADGGLAVVNHPNWQENWDHCPFDLLQKLQGYCGMEIFNGVCVRLEGSGLAIDKWDRLLSSGRKVWGFANDDSHSVEDDGCAWNMVLVRKDQANAAGILSALRDGRFYASTGVRIDWIDAQGSMLQLVADNAEQIEVYGAQGRRLASVEGSELRFNADGVDTAFVRVQLYGRGARMAWTQPFMVRGGAADRLRAMNEKWSSPDAPRPTLTASHVSNIAPLNSEHADAAWTSAQAADTFHNARSAAPATVRTAISALVSDRELALRVVCQEPLMHKISPRIKDVGNSSIWADESIELFLDVEGTGQRYYHLMINPLGAWHVADRMGWSKRLKCDARVVKDNESWTAEFRFDLATLAPHVKPAQGSRMGLHVSRNRKVGGERLVWCWTGANNHVPSRYGMLQL